MLELTDKRWVKLQGGRRALFDPRPLFRKLESGKATKEVWDELWDELHHQGDVGEASYASVPHLVGIYRQQSKIDWNTYAIVGVIELARTGNKNPQLPEWVSESYKQAIQELASLGASQIQSAGDPETVRAILGILALAKGLRTHASFSSSTPTTNLKR